MNLPRQTRDARDAMSAEESHAFTLIELLVVIAIIGLLAALIIPLAGIATVKMRIARVQAELSNYANAIENYKLETGEYPQDNSLLRNMNTSDTNAYKSNSAHHALFYELTGAIFTNAGGQAKFRSLQHGVEVISTDLSNVLKANGIRNSARAKNDIDYKGFSLKDSQYEYLHPGAYGYTSERIDVIAVPVPGPYTLAGGPDGKKPINPWFYDASSTNRHNKTAFDLWAEINVGGKTEVIANWKK
jgi:prepilin-type N-terminal cleavage/methylation domain-containing protein